MTKLPRDLDIKVKIIKSLINAIFKHPEERIGQLIQNCVSIYNKQYCNDIFYVKDKELLSAINRRLE